MACRCGVSEGARLQVLRPLRARSRHKARSHMYGVAHKIRFFLRLLFALALALALALAFALDLPPLSSRPSGGVVEGRGRSPPSAKPKARAGPRSPVATPEGGDP